MSTLSKAIIIGRLGNDPEIRNIESGKKLATFSLATSENKKDGSKETQWHNIELWDKLAEVAEKYVSKGSLIYVEGKLKTDSWEKDGVRHYRTKIVGNQMTMLSSNVPSGIPTVSEELPEQPEDNSLPF